jgi:hypothetical protein
VAGITAEAQVLLGRVITEPLIPAVVVVVKTQLVVLAVFMAPVVLEKTNPIVIMAVRAALV